jgi:hypothetical protein
MSTAATTTGTAGKSCTVETASVLELKDEGTRDFEHFVRNAKKKVDEHNPARKDQQDDPEALKKRLDADIEELDHIIFDTRSNESLMVSGASELILKSGKKKSNPMASFIAHAHPKYKDVDLDFIYVLLSSWA